LFFYLFKWDTKFLEISATQLLYYNFIIIAEKKGKAPKLPSRLMAYATEPRLHNAISKHGSPDNDEINKRIVDEFLEDIFVDVKRDDATLHAEWESTAESEKAKIRNSLTSKANGLIKKFNKSR